MTLFIAGVSIPNNENSLELFDETELSIEKYPSTSSLPNIDDKPLDKFRDDNILDDCVCLIPWETPANIESFAIPPKFLAKSLNNYIETVFSPCHIPWPHWT